MRSSGHFSSASGITVWLVYATVLVTTAQAASNESPCTSISSRISSGAACAAPRSALGRGRPGG